MKTEELLVIKIGGNIIDDPEKLDAFLRDFSKLPGLKILVHGGGKIASEVSLALGIEPKLVKGRRITDMETLKVVTMVYGGLVNKNMVARLQALQCNAIGLTGADANILPALKRDPADGLDYGFAGDIMPEKIGTDILISLLNNRLCPVFAPLTHDSNGSLLNTNADTVASALAMALAAHYQVKLIYCFEKAGVFEDIENENSLIPALSGAAYERLKKENRITDGMLPKLETAFNAIGKGVSNVWIGHAEKVYSFIKEKKNNGTIIHA